MIVTDPARMNETFAAAFNSRMLERLLALYEADAVLKAADDGSEARGTAAIAAELGRLLQLPGSMVSRNNFCMTQGDLALLRADWILSGSDGARLASGSSAELVRRQADGAWKYVIDHAVGASAAAVSSRDQAAVN